MDNEKAVIPPLNFSMVDRGIYRSGFPNKKNFTFLERLGLRSILYLCHQEYPADVASWVKAKNLQLFVCPIDGNKEPFILIDPTAMAHALRFIADPKNRPILVHCTKGTHRTGCIIGCYRKSQHWSLTSIFDEYCRFAKTTIRVLDQQFIEFFRLPEEEEE